MASSQGSHDYYFGPKRTKALYLSCVLTPTQAFILCSLDSYYPWVTREERGLGDGQKVLDFLSLCCILIFSFFFDSIFLIQTSFPLLQHAPRKAPAKDWTVASTSSMSLCIQSLVSLQFLYSGGLLACNTFFWPGKCYCSSRPGFHRVLHSLWNPAWLLQPWLNILFRKN